MYVVLLTRRTPLSLLAHPTQGLIDCITLEALYDPVASPVCGHLFSRTSISAVLATQRLCPLDRSELLISLLLPAQMSLKGTSCSSSYSMLRPHAILGIPYSLPLYYSVHILSLVLRVHTSSFLPLISSLVLLLSFVLGALPIPGTLFSHHPFGTPCTSHSWYSVLV